MSAVNDRKLRRRLAVAALAISLPGTALLLSGCGGSGSADGAVRTAAGQTSDVIVKSDDPVTKGESTEIETGQYPNGEDTDEENISGKHFIKPCNLVSVGKAEKILGANVSRGEHLQGPTCIYTGSGREISLTLQEVSLRQLRKEARKARAVQVGSHKGYCLRFEKSLVAVAIHPHEVLVVGGPCQAGVPFAAAALAML